MNQDRLPTTPKEVVIGQPITVTGLPERRGVQQVVFFDPRYSLAPKDMLVMRKTADAFNRFGGGSSQFDYVYGEICALRGESFSVPKASKKRAVQAITEEVEKIKISSTEGRLNGSYGHSAYSFLRKMGYEKLRLGDELPYSVFPQEDSGMWTMILRHSVHKPVDLQALLSIRILYPTQPLSEILRIATISTGEGVWESEKGYVVNGLFRKRDNDPNNSFIMKQAAFLRINFPEEFDNQIQVTRENWDMFYAQLNMYRQTKTWTEFAICAWYMTILGAKKVHIDETGKIVIELHEPQTQEETALPVLSEI